MKLGWTIGRIGATKITIHASYLLLIAGTFNFFLQCDTYMAGIPLRVVAGCIASIGLFLSILAHEYGHLRWFRNYDIPIDHVTFWAFGAVINTTLITSARQLWRIALGGPYKTGLVFGVMWAIFYIVPPNNIWSFIVLYLAIMNSLILFLNLLPIMPLDGGQALFAAWWSYRKNYWQALYEVSCYCVFFAIIASFVLSSILSWVGIAIIWFCAAANAANFLSTREIFQMEKRGARLITEINRDMANLGFSMQLPPGIDLVCPPDEYIKIKKTEIESLEHLAGALKKLVTASNLAPVGAS